MEIKTLKDSITHPGHTDDRPYPHRPDTSLEACHVTSIWIYINLRTVYKVVIFICKIFYLNNKYAMTCMMSLKFKNCVYLFKTSYSICRALIKDFFRGHLTLGVTFSGVKPDFQESFPLFDV